MALEKDIEQRLIAELAFMAGIYLDHGWRDKAAQTMDLARKIERGTENSSGGELMSGEAAKDRPKGQRDH